MTLGMEEFVEKGGHARKTEFSSEQGPWQGANLFLEGVCAQSLHPVNGHPSMEGPGDGDMIPDYPGGPAEHQRDGSVGRT